MSNTFNYIVPSSCPHICQAGSISEVVLLEFIETSSVFLESYSTNLYDLHCVVGWMVISWSGHLGINAGSACCSAIHNVKLFIKCSC